MADYLIAVEARAYRLSGERFALESAFAEHLRDLRRQTAASFDRLVLAAPQYASEQQLRASGAVSEISHAEGIVFEPLNAPMPALAFWFRALPALSLRLWRAIGRAAIVHSCISIDIWHPITFIITLLGVMRRKRTVFVVDIDFRKSAERYFRLGIWSRKSYLLCHLVYDPIRVAQIKFAVAFCSLVLLKSPRMAADFGRGRPNVKNFVDTAHSSENIIGDAALNVKQTRLADATHPLSIVYFGRLVEYKGIAYAIRAVHEARRSSGRALTATIIGDGDKKAELQSLVTSLGMADCVRFQPPVPYGPELFAVLATMDLVLATPLTEDTPRAAFDAMAAGVPIAAFDLAYYQDLRDLSEAVATTPWLDVAALAREIVALDADRPRIVQMSQSAVRFARSNTQADWIKRRLEWTLNG